MSKSSSSIDRLYSDICAGYSLSSVQLPEKKKKLDIYYRHPSHVELFELEREREKFFENAPPDLLTQEEALDLIIREGWWTREKEETIRMTGNFIKTLRETIAKIPIAAHRKDLETQLRTNQDIVDKLEYERAEYMPRTIESFAAKRINDYCIIKFFCADSSLKRPLFTEDDYYDLSNLAVNTLQMQYYDILTHLGYDNIRKLACGGFFQNLLYISGDVVKDFFDLPTCKITKYQHELFLAGRHFKTMIQNCAQIEKNMPQDKMGDPDAMEAWHEMQLSVHNNKSTGNNRFNNDSGTGGTSMVGATPEENKSLFGSGAGENGLLAAARKAGGRLNRVQA